MSPPMKVSEDGTIDQTYVQAQADYFYALGEAASLDGQPEKAVEEFKHTLVYDPNSTQVRLRLAAEYVKVGLLSEAIEQAELASQKAPRDTDVQMLLGGLFSSIKMYDDAEKAYLNVLAINPKNTEARTYLAALYVERGDYEKAKREFTAVAEDPSNFEPHYAYFYLGRMYLEQGGDANLKSAVEAFSKALVLEPQHEESVLGLANARLMLKQEKQAFALLESFQDRVGPRKTIANLLSQYFLEKQNYDKALEQLSYLEGFEPNNLSVKIKIALLFVEQKRNNAAIVKLEEVLAMVPENDKVRFYLGAVYEETQQPDRAIEHYSQVPASSTFYADSTVHLTYLLKNAGRMDEAVASIEKAIERREDIPQFYALYASLLDEKKDYTQAEKMLKSAVKIFPSNTQLRFFLGSMYDRLGKTESVIDEMNTILKLEPNHVQGLNYLAYTYAESGKNLDEAESLAYRALKLQPQDAYILDTVGWIHFKQGRPEKALKYLETAYKINPKESIIAEHLGDAYYRLQLVEKAKAMYEKAVRSEKDDKKVSEIRSKIAAIDERQSDQVRKPASVSGRR